jgi:hypothetical protein
MAEAKQSTAKPAATKTTARKTATPKPPPGPEVKVTQVGVSYYIGATLLVDGVNWAKPGTSMNVVFDGIPSPEELKKRWDWLLNEIGAHSADLFDAIQERVSVVQEYVSKARSEGAIATPAGASATAASVLTELPPGEAYD